MYEHFSDSEDIIDDIYDTSDIREEYANLNSAKRYFEYYTIKKGDTIYDIARRYNINPELLAALNGLNNNDYIYPDQIILIPKSGYSYYITKAGDTLDSVANIFNMNRDKMLEENDTIYLLEGQMLVKRTR